VEEQARTARQPVVILSTINWSFLWQRHQIFATHLARTGHRVIFVESLGFGPRYFNLSFYASAVEKLLRKSRRSRHEVSTSDLPQNLTVYTPIAAPPRPRVLRRVNRRIFIPRVLREIASMGVQNPVVWSYQPTDTALAIARGLEPMALVYDCVSNYAQVPGIPGDICQTERQWLDAADLVVVDSSFLRQKHAGRRPDLIQLPSGVDYELFNQAYSEENVGAPVRRVCFFGTLGASWFDFDLVRSVADAGFKVSLIGHKGAQHRLFKHANVEYISSVPQTELPALLEPMDALLIPYKVNGFTKGVFPAKIYECLATGKPIVAVPLPDLQGKLSKYIYLANDASEFVNLLWRLPKLETPEKVQSRLALARRNSWESRLDVVSRELERLLRVCSVRQND
jgi:hypothetical protein